MSQNQGYINKKEEDLRNNTKSKINKSQIQLSEISEDDFGYQD